jgi:surface antigen
MAFKMRTTKPGAGNKYYIRKASGGYSNAIKGRPTDKECDVLSNCVGYAYGRFNEIGEYGYCKYLAPVNAENFMDYRGSCQIGMTPKVGACMVWEGKGSLAGHVAIVERVDSDTQVFTSESGYDSSPFWNQTRKKGSGNWGAGSNYIFKGFIYNPAVKDEPKPTPAPTPVAPLKFNIGDKVVINGPLYKSSTASQPAGQVTNKITHITHRVEGAAHPYNTTGVLGWMNESDIKKYEEPKNVLEIGNTVKIIGTGNGSSYGTSNTAYGIGWTRKILDIYTDGRPYPYRVGDNTGTTGFYKASALQKK